MRQMTLKQTAFLAWLVLCALTLITWAIGRAGYAGPLVVGLLLLSVMIKGQVVIDVFMGLRGVRGPWRWLVSGWLVAVLSLIGMAYWTGMQT